MCRLVPCITRELSIASVALPNPYRLGRRTQAGRCTFLLLSQSPVSRCVASRGIRLISGRIFKLPSIILNGRRRSVRGSYFLPQISQSHPGGGRPNSLQQSSGDIPHIILIAQFCRKSIKTTLRCEPNSASFF